MLRGTAMESPKHLVIFEKFVTKVVHFRYISAKICLKIRNNILIGGGGRAP